MASADYYNPSGSGQRPPQQRPPPAQQQQHLAPPRPSGAEAPYPEEPPPPYSAVDPQRTHSQPPPRVRIQQGSSPSPAHAPNASHRPAEANSRPRPKPSAQNLSAQPYANGAPYPSYPLQTQYAQSPQQPPPQHQGYYAGQGTPGKQQVPEGYLPAQQAFQGYPPQQRPHSRSHSHQGRYHHSSHNQYVQDRPAESRKKSSGVKTFLGAGGGAIIGDAIFPGLGTLGGAILGGIGGHEYGKRSQSAADHRSRDRAYSDDRDYYSGSDQRRGRR